MIAAPLAMLIAIRPLLAESRPATEPAERLHVVAGLGPVAAAASRLGGAGGGLRRRGGLLELPGAARRAGRAARARRRAAGLPADRPRPAGALRRPGPLRRLRAARAPTPTCRWSSSPTPTSRPTRRSRSTPATPTARSTSTPSRAGRSNRFPYVITGRAAWNSQAPPNFKRVAATPSYVLWKRTGPTPGGPPRPARGDRGRRRFAGCAAPEIRILLANPGRASLFPGRRDRPERRPGTTAASSAPASSTSQSLQLPAGSWNLSLQYFSPFDLTLSAPGFSEALPAALDGQRPNTISLANNGQFWPAGRYESNGGQVSFTLATAEAEHPAEPDRLRRQGLRRRAGRGPGQAAPDRAAARRPATAGSTGTKLEAEAP